MNYNYQIYFKKKKSGKYRKICIPNPELKAKQREILDQLSESIPLHPSAFAFVKKKNILDNAKVHIKSSHILNIDLSNFFDTINSDMVYRTLINNRVPEELAREITTIAILPRDNHLPQGSPLSPFLANLYCKPLDKRLFTLCKSNSLKYTRYADDITISGNLDSIIRLHKTFHSLIESYHLKINYEKETLSSGYRKKVTGLNVYNKVSAGRARYQYCRSALHHFKYDSCEQVPRDSLDSIVGLASFISYVNPSLEKLKENVNNINKRIKKVS